MSNVNGWQANFTKRCESVGWSVERTQSNHYKVRDANGKFLFVFPTTPGDQRSMRNTIAEAKRHGLEDLESRAKLRAERDRLERIEADRAAVAQVENAEADAALARITELIPDQLETIDYGDVDGVKIVARAPAMHKTPVMSEAKPMNGGEELLLDDHRVVFRCTKPAAMPHRPELEGVCHKIFDTVGGLKIHITYHSRTTVPTPPSTPSSTPEEIEPKMTTTIQRKSASTPAAKHPVEQIAARVTALTDEVGNMITTLQNVSLEFSSIIHDLSRLQIADEEIVAKAKRFDAMRAAFKD